MDPMNEYLRDESLPEGFREALGKNGMALERWSALNDEQRRAAEREIQALRTPRELEQYANDLVDWKEGHPPYQL